MLRRFKVLVAAVALVVFFGAGYFLYMDEHGNFHPITRGEAYRSALLDRDELEHYIKKYEIKSIVNLLGDHPNEPWYREEIEVSADHNLEHYDLTLPVTHEPTEEEARELVEIFKNAPRPVLIHCKAGADRSGLAAAMWKVVVDKEPKSEAMKELSVLYGHIPIGKTIAMDHFFEKWNPAFN
ncbi:MAG: dual specificity protein phosphatase family protein [Deltaproteobacteria bacterium]